MLLVNNAAWDTQTPLQLMHADWGAGVHLADFVFPWFLLCVGVSIPFSVASAKVKKAPPSRLRARVFRRVLFLLGAGVLIQSLVYNTLALSLDVLHLIALSYGLAFWVYRLRPYQRFLLAMVGLVVYGIAFRHCPYPGSTDGFGPDQNVVAWLNVRALSQIHLDGLLSVIPAGSLVVLGSLVGDRMRAVYDPSSEFLSGIAFAVMGWLWSFDLPLSKTYWTSSYILVCGGAGVAALALLRSMERRGWFGRWTAFLRAFGSNALVAYVAPILIKLTILKWIVVPYKGNRLALIDAWLVWSRDAFGFIAGGWFYTLTYIALVWLGVMWLNRRGRLIRL